MGAGVGVGVGVGFGVGVGVGEGIGEAIGPMYCLAITTLSYHFLLTRSLCFACSITTALSSLSVLIERKFKFGKRLASLPSFFPGVFALTISS